MHGGATRRTGLPGYPGLATLFPLWGLIGALACARHHLQWGAYGYRVPVLPDLLGWMVCYLPWALVTPVIFRLERRFPLGSAGWLRHLSCLALASVPIACVASMVMLALGRAMRLILGAPPQPARSWWEFSRCEFLVAEVLYWCTVGGAYMIRKLIELREQERTAARLALEKSQLETGLRQAELEVLRARLNPHFLFNTLQNISVLAQQDPRTASRMLTRLGDLLRMVLRRDAVTETTLEAEMALTHAYVALQKMRFGDRLSVRFEAGPETSRAMVPTLLLQPLVENAIVHGLKGAGTGGAILVRAAGEHRELVLTIRDNGAGPPAEDLSRIRIGLGLGSTAERLERMYPGRHSLSMRRLPEGWTEVRISLPLRLAEAAASTAYASVADR